MSEAADGYKTEEKGMIRDEVIQLPIGTFEFINPDGELRKGTLINQQK